MAVIINGTTGITSPAESVSGNLAFTGTGNRITGDFSNATLANAVIFQTSTTNGSTRLRVMPNGTGTDNALDLFGSTDLANSSRLSLRTSATDMALVSTREGTGTYLPMTFYTGGSERARIASTGQMSTTNGAGVVALAYDARAWVNFNGTGTVAINGSGNVTSVTDGGVGIYTVNFTSALPDANYAVTATTNNGGIVDSPGATTTTKTTTALGVNTRTNTGALTDVSSISVVIFR